MIQVHRIKILERFGPSPVARAERRPDFFSINYAILIDIYFMKNR